MSQNMAGRLGQVRSSILPPHRFYSYIGKMTFQERSMAVKTGVKKSGRGKSPVGTLPRWDLNDLYPGPDSPELARDLAATGEEAERFRTRYQGKLAQLDGGELGNAIAQFERLQETLGRVMSYASLLYAGDMSDSEIARFFQNTQERVNTLSTTLLFFTLELNRIDEAVLTVQTKSPALARYRPWLRDLRAMRPHQLEDALEKLLHEKYVA